MGFFGTKTIGNKTQNNILYESVKITQGFDFDSKEKLFARTLLMCANGATIVDLQSLLEICDEERSLHKRLKNLSELQIQKLLVVQVLWLFENVKETPFFSESYHFDFSRVEKCFSTLFSPLSISKYFSEKCISIKSAKGDITNLQQFYAENIFDILGLSDTAKLFGFMIYVAKHFADSWDNQVRAIRDIYENALYELA